jgi:hypothetical protein
VRVRGQVVHDLKHGRALVSGAGLAGENGHGRKVAGSLERSQRGDAVGQDADLDPAPGEAEVGSHELGPVGHVAFGAVDGAPHGIGVRDHADLEGFPEPLPHAGGAAGAAFPKRGAHRPEVVRPRERFRRGRAVIASCRRLMKTVRVAGQGLDLREYLGPNGREGIAHEQQLAVRGGSSRAGGRSRGRRCPRPSGRPCPRPLRSGASDCRPPRGPGPGGWRRAGSSRSWPGPVLVSFSTRRAWICWRAVSDNAPSVWAWSGATMSPRPRARTETTLLSKARRTDEDRIM